MRILWLSPWLRPLARVQVDALRALGHDTRLVTSDRHPESGTARPDEIVLCPQPKTWATWPEFARALRTVQRFAPDVVVAELVRDPRWLLFAPRRPRVTLVHDDRPHDPSEQRPGWEVRLFDAVTARSAAVLAHSDYVAAALHPLVTDVVPLTSDVDERRVPPPAPAAERRDVVLFGRLNPYKNIDVTLRAWQRHTAGPHWRGDELVIIGDGALTGPLPPHVRWQQGPFAYADVLPVLHRAKASVAHYRRASQSGAQLVSMQLGVVPVVSTVGALPEFLPPGERAVDPDDVTGLAEALDALADPAAAAQRGSAARDHYERRHLASVAAGQLARVLDGVAPSDVSGRGARR